MVQLLNQAKMCLLMQHDPSVDVIYHNVTCHQKHQREVHVS